MNYLQLARGAFALAAAAFALPAHSEIRVDEYLRFRVGTSAAVIPAGQFGQDSFNLKRGDRLEVTVELAPESMRGISVVVCPENAVEEYFNDGAGLACQGFHEAPNGAYIEYEAFEAGRHILIIDNSFARFFEKNLTYDVFLTGRADAEIVRGYTKLLTEIYGGITQAFEAPDFDLRISPCGMSNAFSESVGGHITICSELIFEIGKSVDERIIAGILAHEMGHTLLNLWGQPNWQNEQTADEFAAVILLFAGGTDLAEGYRRYFSNIDPSFEAETARYYDAPHPLSIQRLRNIADIIDRPDAYLPRWRPILYNNMTREALQWEASSTSMYSDSKLAKAILATRAEAAD